MYNFITIPANVEMYKNYMYQAIDESNFDELTRTTFKKTIASVVIGNYQNFFEGNELHILQDDSNLICGKDGMQINAFSTEILRQKYVFFCPGFLINISQIKNKQEQLNAIIHMMSHELAHHIDLKLLGEKVYRPYLTCLFKNYSDLFKKLPSDEILCNKLGLNSDSCKASVIVSHGKELIADQWAIKVLAIHARRLNYTIDQMDNFLKVSFVNICDTVDEGIHPTGDFRIETLLRVNPIISDYLSCNNSSIKKPACTFDGAINL